MSVTNGPRLGTMISAATGDQFPVDFRKFLRQYHALVQCSIKSKTLTAPPGSPANGDAYIVGASATGAWATHDKAIAIWTTDNPATPSGLWEFYGPTKGFGAFNEFDSVVYFYDGTNWTAIGGGGGGSAKSFAQAQGRTSAIVADATNEISLVPAIGDLITVRGTSWTAGEAPQTSPLRGAGSSRKHASADTYCGWYGSAFYFAGLDKVNSLIRGWMSRITDCRFWFGLSDSGSLLTVSDTPSGNYAMFRFSTFASDGHIMCCTSDGSTQTAVSSGVSADLASHSYGLEFDDVTPAVKFYIDGNLVATITTTLPASGTPLGSVALGNWHTATANPLIGAEAFYVQTHGG